MAKIALLLFISFLTTPVTAGWARLSKSSIELRGDIEKNSYGEYLKTARGGFSKIVLHSGGGYPSVALKIAQDIADRKDVEIKVDGVCLSACANYLALAGSRLDVDCHSILGFHGSLLRAEDAAASLKQEGAPEPLIKDYSNWLARFHEDEAAFYRKISVDKRLIADAEEVVNDIHAAVSYTLDEDTGEYSYTSAAGIWIPPLLQLQSYGVRKMTYCDKYTDEVVGEIMKTYGLSFEYSISAIQASKSDARQ